MKRILLPLLSAALLLSCSHAPAYRDDLSAEAVAAEIADPLPDSAGLIRYSDEEIESCLGIPAELSRDRCVMVQTNSVSIDEIGVFRAADEGCAEQLKELLTDYLVRSEEAKADWLRSYNPVELEKLSEGQILHRGRYVIYLILGKADRRIAGENIEKILSE